MDRGRRKKNDRRWGMPIGCMKVAGLSNHKHQDALEANNVMQNGYERRYPHAFFAVHLNLHLRFNRSC